MTVYYTQAQIDEIGTLIGQEILNNSEALKVFVQEKINALEPATPAEPEAGGGTAPAPAAGMFLDDGREIKTKYISTNIPDSGRTQEFTLPHGIDASKVIAVQTSRSNPHLNNFEEGRSSTSEYTFRVLVNDNGVNFFINQPSFNLRLSTLHVLITYLA